MLKEEIIENMKNIVEGCMGEETPACAATCPMHTNVKEYVRLIGEGKGKEAIKVIRDRLFLPASLGRICAHPCEGKCKWNEGRSPMAIASLKRYAADNFDDENDWDIKIKPENGRSVAVIGSGPSGLQAALDLRREGFKVTVYEKNPVRGGMLRVGIPAYRLPKNVLEHELTYLDRLGITFVYDCEIGKDIAFKEITENNDAVVIAAGRQQGRVDRSLEHWDAKRIFSAASFLREAAMTGDVAGCGKTALVVGGGDVAMDCARTALRVSNIGKVYSVCLEDSYDSMAASSHEIKSALDEGVRFNHAQAIKTIHVDDENSITHVTLKKCLSMFDENHRFAPRFDEDDVRELEVDTIIFAIGQGVENVVKHLRDSLGRENVGAMLQCCGKVTRFIGEDGLFEERNRKAIDILDEMGAEVVITVCPSCFKVYKETCRNQRVISYWDLMHDLIGLPEGAKGRGASSDIVFNIHDSCVTRDEPTHHRSIRWMLDEMGYRWEEIERSCGNTRCCGVGGMVCSSRPDLYEKVYERRAKDFSQEDILTYCGSCRGTMEKSGKHASYMLDLLFGDVYMKNDRGDRGYRSEDEMWERRLETKERLNHMN